MLATQGHIILKLPPPSVKRILKHINPSFDFEIISILKKDSLDLDDKDRELIYNTCKKVKNQKIIITHGTDTMVNTAAILSKLANKIIILVGAARPEKFRDSDAPINIGVAIGAVNVLKKGVYIAMNGRVYDWRECRKESKTGKFIKK